MFLIAKLWMRDVEKSIFFLKLHGLKPYSLISYSPKRGKFESFVLKKFSKNMLFLWFLPFKIMIMSNWTFIKF